MEYPGWEEGVVEWLQRSYRQEVLSRLGVRVEETVFVSVEDGHQYNRYITTLLTLPAALSQPPLGFFSVLLETPLKDRSDYVMECGRSLPVEHFRGYQRTFALAFSVLRGD